MKEVMIALIEAVRDSVYFIFVDGGYLSFFIIGMICFTICFCVLLLSCDRATEMKHDCDEAYRLPCDAKCTDCGLNGTPIMATCCDCATNKHKYKKHMPL